MRICSLLPSATEIVASLGLVESLVAVSEECDWPPEVRALPVVSASACVVVVADAPQNAKGFPTPSLRERRSIFLNAKSCEPEGQQDSTRRL
jgi:hypothetical protein